MYTPSHNVENPEVEIVCLMSGESYVHIEGNDRSIIDPKLKDGAIDTLPLRFFKQPFVVNKGNGQIRVFGSLE
jgi:hypothetical protein